MKADGITDLWSFEIFQDGGRPNLGFGATGEGPFDPPFPKTLP